MRKIIIELDETIVELLEEVAGQTGQTLAALLTEAATDYLREEGYIFPE